MKAAVSLTGLYPMYRRDLGRLLDTVRAMDEAGVDQLVASEHALMSEHVEQYPYGAFPSTIDFDWFDPLPLLAAAAAVTRRARLSTGIMVAPLRPAAILAKELATIDHLSAGRLDAGFGVGWQTAEYEACGIPFEGRFGRLEEQVRAMQTLWREAPASFQGKTVAFERVWSVPFPVQPGGVPIWFGLAPTERNFRRIAALGAGWLPYYGLPVDGAEPARASSAVDKPVFSVERLAADVDRLRGVCRESGRDFASLSIRMMLPPLFDADGVPDLESSLAQLPALAEAGLTMFEVSPMMFCRAIDEVEPFAARIVAAARAA